MRKLLLLIAVLGALGLAAPAKAQTAVGEIYVGYTYSNIYVNSGAFDTAGTSVSFPFNGGIVNGQFNLNDYLSIVGYFGGAVTASKTITPLSGSAYSTGTATVINYGGGPRLYIARGRVAPFLEVGLGGATVSESFGGGGSVSAFQLLAGGGVDVSLTSRISIRPVEFDYIMTKFPDGDRNIQSGFGYSGGIIFKLGSKK